MRGAAANARSRDRAPWAIHQAYSVDDLGGWQVYDGATTGGFDQDDLDGLLGGIFGRGGRTGPARRADQVPIPVLAWGVTYKTDEVTATKVHHRNAPWV